MHACCIITTVLKLQLNSLPLANMVKTGRGLTAMLEEK